MDAVPIEKERLTQRRLSYLAQAADTVFLQIETIAYILLGMLLTAAVVLGVVGAAFLLSKSLPVNGQNDALVVAIDRLLFVLMVVEILHTVRVSFRSGTLVCEPFLIVGLIASIRRVLVITLESSQVNEPGKWNAESQSLLHATLLELMVLAVLILVMVTSIYLLRRSKRHPVATRSIEANTLTHPR
jgi:phosphate starvation-inducible membrane PsiE